MIKDFTSYQQALKLKELGFDEQCASFFQKEYHETQPIMVDDNDQYRLTGLRTCKNSEIPEHYTAAPTFAQAFRFFREKYSAVCEIIRKEDGNHSKFIGWVYIDDKKIDVVSYWYSKTYEETELACLEKLIEIVEGTESQK